MKIRSLLLACTLATTTIAHGQAEQRQTLGVAPVEITAAVRESTQRQGTLNALNQLAQGVENQLTDTFAQTRKFQLVARNDLAPILQEQGLALSGNLTADKATELYRLAGAKYLLIVTLDTFQDRSEVGSFELSDMIVHRRTVRAGGVAKIFDTTTGALLTSAAVTADTTEMERQFTESARFDPLNERVLSRTARDLAQKIATRTTDTIYPARVLAKTGQQITINRGENTDIAVGQVWILCAQGEELIDPDTKVSLGRQEVPVGKARVTSVLPAYAIAELTEDFGVQPLQIAYPQK